MLAFIFSTVCSFATFKLVEEPSMKYGRKLLKIVEMKIMVREEDEKSLV